MRKPYTLNRNFVRFSRTNIIIYPPVVKRFALTPACSAFVLWGVLGHDWIFFTPVDYTRSNKLFNINPNGTLYCANIYTAARKQGDYDITEEELLKWPNVPDLSSGLFHTIFKLTRR
jgi:hypothetical protein